MTVNIASLVAQAVSTLAASVDNTVKTVTYKAVSGQPAYNPETGVVTTTTTDYVVTNAVLLQYTRKEREYDFQQSRRVAVEMGDQKCLIPYLSLPITPGGEDTILIDGKEWRVVSHSLDPTGSALHTFQIRIA